MQTPLYPVMDNAVLDYYYFWIPERLTWEHFKEFIGEDTTTAWETQPEYVKPITTAPEGGWNVGTIADYLGFRTGVSNIYGDSALFRAYGLIWNEWFRDENLKDPTMVHLDDANTAGSNGTDYVNDPEKGGYPLKAAKIKNDAFVSALPQTQKGIRALIPLSAGRGVAPVFAGEYNQYIPRKLSEYSDYAKDKMKSPIWGTQGTIKSPVWARTDTGGGTISEDNMFNLYDGSNGHTLAMYNATTGAYTGYVSTASTPTAEITPINLWADIGNGIQAGTINDLRTAISIQQLLEAYARGGTRYREILRSIYNTYIPDTTVQIPEYLCGGRIPINMDQVLQTSATGDNTTPLGETGAFSNTAFKEFSFEKGFVEHGYIMGVAVIRRAKATYSQGVPFLSQRRTRYDYFFPQFMNLGEEAIENKYIYAQGTDEDEEVFGYQERYFAYRSEQNMIMGEFRPDYAQSLDAWHYGDNYSELPTLSSGWIDEDKSVFDRTLAVQSSNAHQFLFDIYLTGEAIRPLSVHGIPGLTRL